MKKWILVTAAVFILCVLGPALFQESSADTKLINTHPLDSYPGGISVALTRMVQSGIAIENIRFNAPEEFAKLKNPEHGIFHPDGGGARYHNAKPKYMANGKEGKWVFNAEVNIAKTGTTNGEITAFLVGVSKETCSDLNKRFYQNQKLSAIPRLKSDQSNLYNKNNIVDNGTAYKFPSVVPTLDNPDWEGQYAGCFQSFNNDSYVYYQVIVPR